MQRHSNANKLRHEQLKIELRRLMEPLQAGDPLPPVTELIERFNISRTTATRAIQALQAEGLLEGRSGSGVYLTQRAKLHTVAFVTRWRGLGSDSPFERMFMDSLMALGPTFGQHVECYFKHESYVGRQWGFEDFQKSISDGRIQCLLTADSVPESRWLEEIATYGLPTVTLGFTNFSNDIFQNQVSVDGKAVIQLGIDTLVRKGCRRIAFFGHHQIDYQDKEKHSWRNILESHGLSYDPDLCCYIQTELKALEMRGYRELQLRWPKWPIKPDGIVSLDDRVTVGLLYALRDMGLKVGKDIQVASQTNKKLSEFDVEPVFRMEIDPAEVARQMLQWSQARIEGLPTDHLSRFVEPDLRVPAFRS